MPNQPPVQQPPIATVTNGQNQQPQNKKSFWSKFIKILIIVIVAIVLAAVLGAIYVFVSMGVIKVPVVSGLVYKPSQATREVPVETLDNSKINKTLSSELSRGRSEAQVNITEGNLTYILQNNYLEDLKIENPQVALISGGNQMEIYGKISGLDSDLLAIYDIGLDQNGKFLAKRLVSLRIGGFTVPDYLIKSKYISEETLRKISGADLIENTLSDQGSGLKINKMTIEEGKITEYVSVGSGESPANNLQAQSGSNAPESNNY